MRIFLIGFMGSGKTTLGRRLATKLAYPFIDMDKEIESHINMSIAEYFKEYGEEAFRKIENEVLKTSTYPESAIIATGGGAPCFYDNLDWMNKNGLTVYLSLSPKALAKRLVNATDERPVLKNLKGDELECFITEKLKLREAFYTQAKLTIKGADQTPERFSAILKEGNYLK
ncbi:shikimate kinase [Paradesertivirga mongoliensis]|uniref:Shikimate kinase n=1 Tax=Paradesertivirga mongoliensis TaxID=2100740 RepID=A0ABW4ZLT0_9SPHI|nr:shikimate kinase [Pedobacter mongoliensis]